MKKIGSKIKGNGTIGEIHKQRLKKYKSKLFIKRDVNDFRLETRSDKLFK